MMRRELLQSIAREICVIDMLLSSWSSEVGERVWSSWSSEIGERV